MNETRWTSLQQFVRDWYRDPLGEPVAGVDQRIQAAEEQLGHPLPAALREWFRLVEGRLESFQNEFPRLDGLRLEKGWVHVLSEVQGNWFCGIRADATEPDPPVSFNGEQEIAPQLSLFLTQASMWDTVTYAALERFFVQDEAEIMNGTFGRASPAVRGRELAPSYAVYPVDGLELQAEIPVWAGSVRLLTDGAGETLVVNRMDDSQPPALLGTMIATRTAAADAAVTRTVQSIVQARADQAARAKAEQKAQKQAERDALLAGIPTAPAELLASLEALEDELLRFERPFLDELRRAVNMGRVPDALRNKAATLIKKHRT